jgi:hypothetical protein
VLNLVLGDGSEHSGHEAAGPPGTGTRAVAKAELVPGQVRGLLCRPTAPRPRPMDSAVLAEALRMVRAHTPAIQAGQRVGGSRATPTTCPSGHASVGNCVKAMHCIHLGTQSERASSRLPPTSRGSSLLSLCRPVAVVPPPAAAVPAPRRPTLRRLYRRGVSVERSGL